MGWIVEVFTPYEGISSNLFEEASEAVEFIKFHYMPGYDFEVTVRPATVEYSKTEFLEKAESGEIT